MLTTLFTGVLQLSIQGSVLLLIVLVLRRLLRALGAPRVLNTFLWCAVLFQLLCPLRIPLALISYSPPTIESAITSTTEILSQHLPFAIADADSAESTPSSTAHEGTNAQDSTTPTATKDGTAYHAESSTVDLQSTNYILIALAWLWLLGTLLLLFRGAAQYDFLRKHVRLAYRMQEGAQLYYTGTGVHTPFILGIFRPRIYLPSISNSTEKAYIYQHEQAHLQHGDFLWKPLFYLALSFHWFNPLVWLAMRQMAIDLEIACDEAVLTQFGATIKPCYCNSLLRFAHAPRYATMPLCFGEGDFTQRIKDILTYKKPTFWAICSGAFLAGTLCLLCLLNPFATTTQEASDNTTDDSTLSAQTDIINETATPQPSALPSAVGMTEEEFTEAYGDEFDLAIIETPTPLPTVAPTTEPSSELSETPVVSAAPSATTDAPNDSAKTEAETATQPVGDTTAALTNNSSISLLWPVPQYSYISRWTVAGEHDGIDIAADAGTAIYAAASGTILAAGYNAAGTGYGYSVIIDHGNGFQTLYAHGLTVAVEEGDTVEQGDWIMDVGSTGYSVGNHLHFELFINDVSLPFAEGDTSIFTITE